MTTVADAQSARRKRWQERCERERDQLHSVATEELALDVVGDMRHVVDE